jgi:hypothetical protein
MSRIWLAAVVLGSGLSVFACGDEHEESLCHEDGHEHEGTATGSACNGSTLTYESFGRAFMENYCTRCHSSALEGEEARSCAPADHNFDTLDGILFAREHIDEHAAAGPTVVNDGMPPNGAMPSAQERRDLGTWLACEEENMP